MKSSAYSPYLKILSLGVLCFAIGCTQDRRVEYVLLTRTQPPSNTLNTNAAIDTAREVFKQRRRVSIPTTVSPEVQRREQWEVTVMGPGSPIKYTVDRQSATITRTLMGLNGHMPPTEYFPTQRKHASISDNDSQKHTEGDRDLTAADAVGRVYDIRYKQSGKRAFNSPPIVISQPLWLLEFSVNTNTYYMWAVSSGDFYNFSVGSSTIDSASQPKGQSHQ